MAGTFLAMRRIMLCGWKVRKSQDHKGSWKQGKEIWMGFYHKCHREPQEIFKKDLIQPDLFF